MNLREIKPVYEDVCELYRKGLVGICNDHVHVMAEDFHKMVPVDVEIKVCRNGKNVELNAIVDGVPIVALT